MARRFGTILTPFPVRVRELATFTGTDPWTGGRQTTWHLDLCMMAAVLRGTAESAVRRARQVTHAGSVGPGGRQLAAGEAIALWCPPDGEPRVLPRVLAELWRQGECATERLPGILHAIRHRLSWSDFVLGGGLLRIGRGLVLACLLAAAGFLLATISLAPPMSHRTLEVDWASWVAAPARPSQEVWLRGSVHAEGSMAWPSAGPAVPEGIEAEAGTYRLGWYRAGATRRLVAWREPANGSIPSLDWGTVWQPDTVGLASLALDPIRRRIPDLDVSRILMVDWRWRDRGEFLGLPVEVSRWLASLPLAMAILLAVAGWWVRFHDAALIRHIRAARDG